MLDTKSYLDNCLICGIWLFSASLMINYPLVGRRIHNGSITGSAGVGAELMGFGVNLERIIGIAQTKVFQSLVENLICESEHFLKITSKNSYIDVILKLCRFMHNYCSHNTFANEMVHANAYILDAVNAAQQTLQATLGKTDFERLQRSLAG